MIYLYVEEQEGGYALRLDVGGLQFKASQVAGSQVDAERMAKEASSILSTSVCRVAPTVEVKAPTSASEKP